MKLIGVVVVRQLKEVGSFVTIGEIGAEVSLRVEGLVNVANIVDQETKCVRLSKLRLARVKTVLNVIVHIALEVFFAVVCWADPLNNRLDTEGKIVL